MKNKKGFTLIELLAVIIILGILMIIAIPSVTRYISDSRKSSYVDTAKEIIGGARNMVNDGKLEMYDTDVTYYIESSCIKTENASKSPYGEFTKAYVVVTYDGNGYTYYWTGNDDSGQGIKNIVRVDKLDTDNVESDLKDSEISTLRGIDGRSKTVVVSKQNNCQKEGTNDTEISIDGETGEMSLSYSPETLKDKSINDLYNINNTNIYIFKGGNPSNYVKFNCSSNNNCETWRIIGIYGNQFKIISTTSPTVMKYKNTIVGSNAWVGSNPEIYLNKDTDGGYYYSLSNSAKEMIVEGTWYVGATDTGDTFIAENAYTNSLTITSTRKVGLLEAFEYLYASDGDNCYSTPGINYSTMCGDTEHNWLNYEKTMWTLTPSNNSSRVMHIGTNGYIYSYYVYSDYYLFPVVYLNSSVKITGGTGTSADPYTLEM